MERTLIVGRDKTSFMMYLAELVTALGKSVAILDLTTSFEFLSLTAGDGADGDVYNWGDVTVSRKESSVPRDADICFVIADDEGALNGVSYDKVIIVTDSFLRNARVFVRRFDTMLKEEHDFYVVVDDINLAGAPNNAILFTLGLSGLPNEKRYFINRNYDDGAVMTAFDTHNRIKLKRLSKGYRKALSDVCLMIIPDIDKKLLKKVV